ncbi:carboxypeptidase regulatory-like domain-containing protein [Archangium violaceum]|uniref:Carboxypeptidase regulatory-like domain-containing protein n=1 Tax=Archangium violaceum Cb vi76 TaxID=1406225 RepID=A0A084SSD0_9BACT|nr:carboxypeptidase regulatory-like domain-containing protein [Archangium violaceum]KFA91365.1 hypothetical protein Q664_22555 [Archangium violaceum Cb vi76]
MKRIKYSRGLTALWVALILGLASESSAEQYELFAGILRDSSGNPLVGTVSVSSSGSTEVATTRSLADGSFELYALYAESYIINASAPGHLPYSQTNVALPREDLMLQLVPAETFTIDPTQPARVTDSRGTQLELPAGALVDKMGRSPSGDITVSMYTYGSDTEAMPGNRTGVKLDGQRTALRSLGAVSVEFTDGEGKYYNLATGRRARLMVQLPEGIVEPEPVPLWSYNPQDGLWYQGEGSGTQSGSVIAGEVEHFSVWNFSVSFDEPACIQITVDSMWFDEVERLAHMRATALTFKADPEDMLINKLGPHAFYDLEPNSLVLFELYDTDDKKFKPYAIVNAGGSWGGKPGIPPLPSEYNKCNGKLTVNGIAQVGAVKGQVLLQHRDSHAGVDIEVSINGSPLHVTTDATGNFNVMAPAGKVTVIARKAGYLPVEFQNADVTAGTLATDLGAATLLAGDVDNKDGRHCVDTADMRAINSVIPSSTTPANEVLDINADLKIDFTDLRLAAGNGRKCGPTPWVKAKQ